MEARRIDDPEACLRRLERLSHLLDNAFRVPGTQARFGLDPLLGLLPGVGDVVGLCLSGYIIVQARRLGASRGLVAAMIANVAVDAIVGAVPGFGDAFDFVWKANARNLRLLRQMAAARRPVDERTGHSAAASGAGR